MNKRIAKAAAALVCGALAFSAASCGNTTATALTIDGTDVRAGIYIFYQMQAVSDAAAKLKEEQPDLDQNAEDFDLLQYSIEGTPARDWVKNKTVELCRQFAAAEKLFDECGLSFTAEENQSIREYANSLWTEENMYAQYLYGVDIIGEYYEKHGIGKQSFQDTYAVSLKKDKLFDYYYGENGTLAVPADELNAAVKENYALVKYFEADAEIGSAQDYVDKLNGGAPFAEVKQGYDMMKEVAQIEADMAEAKAAGEEYEGTLPEEVNVAQAEESALQSVIAKDSSSPSEDFVSAVFEMSEGENKVISVSSASTAEDGTETTAVKYYVVSRLDIASDESVMENYRNTERHKQKDDELEKLFSDTGAGYSLTENAAAISKYKVENVMQ